MLIAQWTVGNFAVDWFEASKFIILIMTIVFDCFDLFEYEIDKFLVFKTATQALNNCLQIRAVAILLLAGIHLIWLNKILKI